MNSWKCRGCDEGLSAQGNKVLGVNDTYIVIYQCNKCQTKGYTVAKNSKDIAGAKTLKVLDKELHSQREIDQAIGQWVK